MFTDKKNWQDSGEERPLGSVVQVAENIAENNSGSYDNFHTGVDPHEDKESQRSPPGDRAVIPWRHFQTVTYFPFFPVENQSLKHPDQYQSDGDDAFEENENILLAFRETLTQEGFERPQEYYGRKEQETNDPRAEQPPADTPAEIVQEPVVVNNLFYVFNIVLQLDLTAGVSF